MRVQAFLYAPPLAVFTLEFHDIVLPIRMSNSMYVLFLIHGLHECSPHPTWSPPFHLLHKPEKGSIASLCLEKR